MFYYEEDYRGLETQIIRFIRDLLSSYNITPQELVRLVVSEFSISATRSHIDFVTDQYHKYKDRK